MIRPVSIPVGQGFGANPTRHQPHPVFGDYQPDGHTGQDYPVNMATPIRAVTDGVVVHVGYYRGTYRDNPFWISPGFAGFCYVIDHGSFIGIYAHGLDNAARVAPGQAVAEGQVIGLSGNTGGSTGPHLHFEVLPDQFVVTGPHYGRIDPETLFSGAITAQSSTVQDWTDMASEAEVEAAAYRGALKALEWKVDNTAGGKTSVLDVARIIDQRFNEAPGALLDAQVPRAGEFGGNTSLRGVLAYADQKHIEALRATVTAAHGDGVTADQIIQAVRETLAAGIKVEAIVKVGE